MKRACGTFPPLSRKIVCLQISMYPFLKLLTRLILWVWNKFRIKYFNKLYPFCIIATFLLNCYEFFYFYNFVYTRINIRISSNVAYIMKINHSIRWKPMKFTNMWAFVNIVHCQGYWKLMTRTLLLFYNNLLYSPKKTYYLKPCFSCLMYRRLRKFILFFTIIEGVSIAAIFSY